LQSTNAGKVYHHSVSFLHTRRRITVESTVKLADGVYRVETEFFCAGFVIANGKVTECAPILRRNFNYWKKKAVLIPPKEIEEKP